MVRKKRRGEMSEVSGPGMTAEITVPLGDLEAGQYNPRHLDLRLTVQQAASLRRVYVGLNDGHAQLADGRHIDSAADAVRWLLERVGEKAERERQTQKG